MSPLILKAAQLQTICAQTGPAAHCKCPVGACRGWESVPPERWPAERMKPVASLRDPEIEDPGFEECHPLGTRYESPDAPVVPGFFPYNRCELWQCEQCRRLLLRYTEFGGYYVDHRTREIGPDTPMLDGPRA